MLSTFRRRASAVHAAAGLLFCSAFFVSALAPAQPPDRAHLDQVLSGLARGQSIGQVAVSPNGQSLAWIQYAPGGEEIRLAPIADLARSRRVTASLSEQHCNEDDLVWSPNSSALAFFSDCARPGQQPDLYLAAMDATPVRRLTQLNGYVQQPAFSPDGKTIAFLYVEGATRPAGALAAQDLPSGVIGETKSDIQRIAIVSAAAEAAATPAVSPASGAPADRSSSVGWASPADLHVFEYDWSPDSKSFAYIAADPPGENNWWVARLYTQPLAAPSPNAILDPAKVSGLLHGLQIAVPRWSPDAKSIAFIGGLMSDQGVTGGDLWIVPSAGGQPADLTPNRPSTPAWMVWASGRTLYVSELAGGSSRLVRFNLDPSRTRATQDATVFNFPGNIGDGRFELSLSPTADRSVFVYRASTFDRPTEMYAARTTPASQAPAEVSQISHFNEGVTPAWGKSLSIDWTNEGFHVQGWLMLPKDYDPARKYPLIVEVHGGPASAVVARWGAGGSLSPAAFSALGYFVLQPNPRGSFGQGEAFTQANRKDFGYGDLRDILAGVDAVQAKFPIDPARVGLTGWSYGGFMTMFAATQTHRFKAAVAGAGISDWRSYYGENSIDQWMIPYFGASVYDDPQIYEKSSAINFIKPSAPPHPRSRRRPRW